MTTLVVVDLVVGCDLVMLVYTSLRVDAGLVRDFHPPQRVHCVLETA